MERKILKKKILGIFCTLCLCICMMSGSTVVYGAGVSALHLKNSLYYSPFPAK